ncbi:hypothetical protein ABPG72_009966 [Tetrahymena utriculariae]
MNCQRCYYNCKQCWRNSSQCFECFESYQVDIISSKFVPICFQWCQTCDILLLINSCTSCQPGYFLSKGRCLNCISQSNNYQDAIPQECQNIVTDTQCGAQYKICLKSDPSFCVKCISQQTIGQPSQRCLKGFNFTKGK